MSGPPNSTDGIWYKPVAYLGRVKQDLLCTRATTVGQVQIVKSDIGSASLPKFAILKLGLIDDQRVNEAEFYSKFC